MDGSVVEADASCERRLPGDSLPEAWSNRESQAQPVRAYFEALICPTGRELTYRGAHYAARVHTYRSNAADCAACPGRQGCTSGRVRTIVRLFDKDARDHARSLRDTPAYAQSCRERKKVEMLFAHLKRHLKLTRLRLRGLLSRSRQ